MPPPRLYKTEAIVLRQRRLGEADRILTVFTPAHGKLNVTARGVRKITSRMGGHLQPLTRCMMQLAQGHTMDVVAGCQTMEPFAELREDLPALSRALYMAELVDRFVQERSEAYSIYQLLLAALRRLDQARDGEGRSARLDTGVRFFEMRLLAEAGFRPQLNHCVVCEEAPPPSANFFVPSEGGIACARCVPGAAGPRRLSVDGLKLMRMLQQRPYEDSARVRIPADVAQEVEHHLRSYVVYVLERDINAAAFIERLRRGEPFVPVEA